MHQIKFYRTDNLPSIGEIGSFYFLHEDINSLYVCINNSGDQNIDYENYSGHTYWSDDSWSDGEGGSTETPSTPSNLYLPLTGGTMSGDIDFASGSILFSGGQDGSISIPNQGILQLEAGGSFLQLGQDRVISNVQINAPAFYETSDIRKKDIKSDLSLDKCYDLIDKCQTVIYSLKDQTKEQVGMIAQEIEEFFPEVVATDEEGFKSLAYDRLVVICFKVLKDVIKRLEKLENV